MAKEKNNEYIARRVAPIISVLQNVAMGDFSQSLEVPEKEDEFTELSVALNLMIDDLKEASKAEKLKYDVIMANISEGICFTKVDNETIVYANPKFEKMFGYETGEMIGKNVASINAPTSKSPEETAREIINALKNTGEWHGEIKNIKKDGTTFWCYASASEFEHLEYGKVWIALHTDITERKKESDALERVNKLMVGRELEMKALKKRIEELEKPK